MMYAGRWLLIWLLLAPARLTLAQPRPAYPGPDGPVTLLVAQADGGVLVGGAFTHFAGRPSPGGLARLLPSGRPDTTFALPAAWVAYARLHPLALAPLPSGRMVAAFTFEQPLCQGCAAQGEAQFLVRLLPDGQLDATFTSAVQPLRPPSNDSLTSIAALAVQPDGRVLLVGSFLRSGTGSPRLYHQVLRLLPDGRLDSSFAAAANPPHGIERLTVLPNGGILLAYRASSELVRLKPNGQTDPGFAPRAERPAPQRALTTGHATPPAPLRQLPADWDGGTPKAMLAGPNGTLLLGGSESADLATDPARSLARLLPNGHRDSTFRPIRGFDQIGVSALARQPPP